MPPKKRAANKAAATPPRRSGRQVEATSASSRPKRAAASAPTAAEEPKSKRSKVASQENAKNARKAETVDGPKRRGRPPKASSIEQASPAPASAKKGPGRPKKVPTKEPEQEEQASNEPPKRKGRPAKGGSTTVAGPSAPKATTSRRGRSAQDPKDLPLSERTQQAEATEQLEAELEQAIEEEAVRGAKPRGRPPKAKTGAATTEQAIEEEAVRGAKTRGRPPKAKTEAATVPTGTSATIGKKRGRAALKEAKTGQDIEEEEPSAPAKRAKKSAATTKAEVPKTDPVQKGGLKKTEANAKEKNDADEQVAPVATKGQKRKSGAMSSTTTPAPSKRGRKPAAPEKTAQEDDDDEVEVDAVEMADEFGRRFWLMKAEPESRMDKGVDVKFSIDDLKACTEPEPWTGVRNYVARNNMQSMKLGDLAFFYHSNCKVPGIAGIMEIVREATVDESAFDKDDPYYDAKSDRGKPKWFHVHVEFRQKLPEYLGLAELKEHQDGKLSNMQLLKQSRLSVSKVSKAEWDFIMELCGAMPVPPANGVSTASKEPVAGTEAAAGPSTDTKKPRSTDPKRKGPRATSLGPALQAPVPASNRASSAQPAFYPAPAQAAVLESVTEDETSGTVPPAFVLRSSPPAPQAVAEETNGESAGDAEELEPLQNGSSNPTEDSKESTWLADMVDTDQALTGDQGLGAQAISGAEQDFTLGDESAPPVPTLSLEATPVEEAMKKVQSDMESSVMTF